MKVHNTLGNGFQEKIYQRCLAIELERVNLNFALEVEQEIFYEGINICRKEKGRFYYRKQIGI